MELHASLVAHTAGLGATFYYFVDPPFTEDRA